MVRRLKTAHAGAAHQYAPQEEYNDFHDGDTYEEIEMEAAPVATPDLIVVSDEEDPEEVNPEGGDRADQPNQEEQAPGEDLDDHHGPEVEEEVQEQDEAAEEVIWDVYHYRVDGVAIPMADHLRAMVLRLGYDKAPVYHCELWTHPWFEPHWKVADILEEYVPFHGAREISKHHDVAHRTTMDAGIAEVAWRALYVLSHNEHDRLEDTHCRYTPFRASREDKTYIAPDPAYEGTLNNVRSLLAAVNTALDDTTTLCTWHNSRSSLWSCRSVPWKLHCRTGSSQWFITPQKHVPPHHPRGHATTPLTPARMPCQKRIVLRLNLRLRSFCNR
jgi:hypothetical protein